MILEPDLRIDRQQYEEYIKKDRYRPDVYLALFPIIVDDQLNALRVKDFEVIAEVHSNDHLKVLLRCEISIDFEP